MLKLGYKNTDGNTVVTVSGCVTPWTLDGGLTDDIDGHENSLNFAVLHISSLWSEGATPLEK